MEERERLELLEAVEQELGTGRSVAASRSGDRPGGTRTQVCKGPGGWVPESCSARELKSRERDGAGGASQDAGFPRSQVRRPGLRGGLWLEVF